MYPENVTIQPHFILNVIRSHPLGKTYISTIGITGRPEYISARLSRRSFALREFNTTKTVPKTWKDQTSPAVLSVRVALPPKYTIPWFFESWAYESQQNSFGISKRLPKRGSGRGPGGYGSRPLL
jgi:hypothetical protein